MASYDVGQPTVPCVDGLSEVPRRATVADPAGLERCLQGGDGFKMLDVSRAVGVGEKMPKKKRELYMAIL